MKVLNWRLGARCSIAFLIVGSSASHSQSASDSAPLIQQITVTAQKREQSLQDVGLTMAVLNADEINARGYRNLAETTSAISNVELFEDFPSAGVPTWIIRGVGVQDFNSNNTPTASVYLDEIYQSSVVMGGVGLFDVNRLEVLKGPQGGLYGRNTTGGAVLLNTNRAILGESEGGLTFRYGSWDAVTFEGFANISLSDRLAWRLSGRVDERGEAWQRSLASETTHGEKQRWDLRSWLHFQPIQGVDLEWKIQGGEDNSDIDLARTVGIYNAAGSFCASMLEGSRDDANCLSWAGFNQLVQALPNTNPVDSQAQDGSLVLSDPLNEQQNNYLSTLVVVDKEFSGVKFSSITGFDIFDYGVNLDLDGANGEFGHRFSSSDIEIFSQEFRVVSADNQVLTWLGGITFSEEMFEERRQFYFRDNFVVVNAQGLSFGNVDYDQNTSSQSVYGNLRYVFNPSWALNFSLRYTNEDKEYRNGAVYIPGQAPFYVFDNLSRDYSLEDRLSGNFILEWTLNNDFLLYFSYADGYKSGGFYGGFPSYPQEIDPYSEETISAYEIGFKSDISSSLRLNAAAFFYDYKNVQGFISRFNALSGTQINVLSNQGNAVHTGVELEVDWFPVESFNIAANLGYLDATMQNDGVLTLDIFGNSVPVAGRRPYAPLWNLAASLNYEFLELTNYSVTGGLYYDYRSRFSGAHTSPTEEALYGLPPYGVWNGNINLVAQNNWSLAFRIKNIFDKTYRTRVKSDGLMSYSDLYGQPRQYEVEFGVSW